jgi:hypothetical protein
MPLEKQIVIDKIEVLETGQIQVREATRIFEDGKVLSQAFRRYVLEPGANTVGEVTKVQAIASVVWTAGVLKDWADFKKAQSL